MTKIDLVPTEYKVEGILVTAYIGPIPVAAIETTQDSLVVSFAQADNSYPYSCAYYGLKQTSLAASEIEQEGGEYVLSLIADAIDYGVDVVMTDAVRGQALCGFTAFDIEYNPENGSVLLRNNIGTFTAPSVEEIGNVLLSALEVAQDAAIKA